MVRQSPICAALLTACASLCFADTIYVNADAGDDAWNGLCQTWDGADCGPKATIRAGVNAAQDGDEVVVADGVYSSRDDTSVWIQHKAVVLRSENGPDNCTIDCGASDYALAIFGHETDETIVDGFAIINGAGGFPDAAVYCDGRATVRNCVFQNHEETAVYCRSDVLIENCVFDQGDIDGGDDLVMLNGEQSHLRNCTFRNHRGAVIHCWGGILIEDCVLDQCDADRSEGLITLGRGQAHLRNCLFQNHQGPVVECSSDTLIEDCVFDRCSLGAADDLVTLSGQGYLKNCIFSNNQGTPYAQAVFAHGGEHTFEDCQFIDNNAGTDPDDGLGVAVCLQWASGTFIRCKFDNNRFTGGQAVTVIGTFLRLIECQITNCTVRLSSPPDLPGSCWAVSFYGDSLQVDSCTIENNNAAGVAFAAYGDKGAVSISNSTISHGGGAAVLCMNSALAITNCTLQGNHLATEGGAVQVYRGDALLTNCLIAGNRATNGGAIYGWRGGSIRVVDCTLADNTAASGSAIYSLSDGYAPRIDIVNSIIACGDDPIWADEGTLVRTSYSNIPGWSGEGCINADALFVSPGHWDDNGTPEDETDDAWIDGDYALQAGSPCIDAGNVFLLPRDADDLDNDGSRTDPIPFDLAGMSRFHDDPATPDTGVGTVYYPVVDMGAYEFGAEAGALEGPSFADLNCDDRINAFDIDPFVLALTDASAYADVYPSCDVRNADCNGDGQIGVFDIDAFVKMLVGAI